MFTSMVLASIAAALALVCGVRIVAVFFAGSIEESRATYLAAYVGAALAAIPAFFASITVGGTTGGAWAEAIAGVPAVPVGVALGMFVVLVGLVLAMSALAAVVVRLVRG